jgi:hypothetical protein
VPARSSPGDLALALLVLGAMASILAAPVLGRSGHAGAADLAMGAAAGCGVASFALAGAATLRAARRSAGARRRGGKRP